MSDTRIKPSASLIGASSQTAYVAAKGMLDGTAFTADWLARMAAEGRMYTAHAGTGTAPVTFAGAYVNTTPDFDMSVPAGVLVVPVALAVQYETYGTILLTECVAAVGVGGVLTPTGAEAVTVVNHRLDLPDNSGVSAVSTGTGATYMTSHIVEFFRDGHQADVTASAIATGDQASNLHKFRWSALETGNWPFMYSTSSITRLNIFACSQAGTGFISLTFVVPPLSVS